MNAGPNAMGPLLDRLCEHFDQELERQQNVLMICRALGRGARAQDHEYLEAKTAALQALLRQVVAAEQVRLVLVHEVVDLFDLPESQQTLTGLIAVTPEPWRRRMLEFQVLIRATMETTRRLVRDNNRVLRRSLQVVSQTLAAMAQCEPNGSGAYNGHGSEVAQKLTAPSLIDQRG